MEARAHIKSYSPTVHISMDQAEEKRRLNSCLQGQTHLSLKWKRADTKNNSLTARIFVAQAEEK